MNVLLLAASLFSLIILVYWIVKGLSADPYGEFHLGLNKLPGDDVPRTEWLNMGYWKVHNTSATNVFPEACQALAMKLVRAARCKPGGRVLDVGHGTGESLIFLLTHPSVPRPSHLTGITSLASHHERSQARVARLNQTVPVDLHVGDAVQRPGVHEHPLAPSSEANKFDTILALDCAYHFRSRAAFLRQVYSRLRPGGAVALADICFANGALETRWTRFVMAAVGSGLMPRENRISTDEYIAQMREIGFTEVELEDVTKDVFPGFISFLATRGTGWWILSRVFTILWGSGARFVVVKGNLL
ncbi:S-adenosyl-L-methionine-dependent methyltransferase [Mycena haematopus]|nr:S-adenosyl-L-methionine-dependent methyltransferase [Mycena haematopus]